MLFETQKLPRLSNVTKKTYLFTLRDEENSVNRGVWILDTILEPGEILSKIGIISARFLYRWTLCLTVREYSHNSGGQVTLVKVLQAIGNVIKKNTETVESTCTSVIIRPNNPSKYDAPLRTWSRDDEHRKNLEL